MVVARRSQALGALCGAGSMASVLLGADRLEPLLAPWGAALSIATINGPSHSIISGTPAALAEFTAACDRDGIQIRPIAVDYASHSAQIEPLRERLLGELADVTPARCAYPAVLDGGRRAFGRSARHDDDGRRLLVSQPA